MGTRVSITGQADLRKTAAQCRAEARTLQRNMVKGASKGVKLLKPAIKAAMPAFLPSGYAPLAIRSLSVTQTSGPTGVKVKILARGKTELRDLNARNKGSLRHPVFRRFRQLADGRWVKNPWVNQAIKPGVIDVPFEETKPRIIAAVDEALGDVGQRIEGG